MAAGLLAVGAGTGLAGVPTRPEGDYAVGQDWQGYTMLGLALLVLIIGIGTLPRPGRRVRSDGDLTHS